MLDELIAVLKPHIGQKETIEHFFNRQLHERIVRRPLLEPLADMRLLRLSDEEINVIEEFWSTAQFKVFDPWHTRKNPVRTDIPVVVFRGWDKLLLIDGQNRVNLWNAMGNHEPHRVLVVEPQPKIIDPFSTATMNRR